MPRPSRGSTRPAILEVAEISQREYRDGIYPQDLGSSASTSRPARSRRNVPRSNLEWSRDMKQKGFRTTAQLKADELNDQQASIALEEAEGMLERLVKFTGPKNLKSLEAKIKAIQADKKNQEAAFELEKQRLARLQKCIDNCTLRAPRRRNPRLRQPGQSVGTGRPADRTGNHRPGGPVDLPASRPAAHMRVKTRVNETKVGPDQDGTGGDHPG